MNKQNPKSWFCPILTKVVFLREKSEKTSNIFSDICPISNFHAQICGPAWYISSPHGTRIVASTAQQPIN